MVVYNLFDRPDPEESKIIFNDPSRTQQQFAEDANINAIIAKYISSGGYIDPFVLNNKEPVYGDVSQVADLKDSIMIVKQAEEQFEALPSALRERFGNNAIALLEFVSDSRNLEEARKLGLVEALPVTPLDVTGTSDTTPEPQTKEV